jgi:hypothetical protein
MGIFVWIVFVIGASWVVTGLVTGQLLQVLLGASLTAWGLYGIRRSRGNADAETQVRPRRPY